MALIDLSSPDWSNLMSVASAGLQPTATTTAAPSSGFNWSSLLNAGLPLISNLTSNPTLTGLPRTLEQVGGITSLISGLRDQPTVTIPNYSDFASPYGINASNYLQGAFQNPADPFAPGGTYEQYLPLLNQQKTQILNDAQQRIIAGLPGGLSTSMGGSEIGAIGEALQKRIAPSYQALFADLQRENLSRQLQAATTLGGYEKFGQQAGFEAALQGAQQAAEAERNRNAQLVQLGLALIAGGNVQAGQQLLNQAQQGTAGGTQGGIGSAIQQFLGGGTSGMGQYAPIGQMSVADIYASMQAGTLSSAEGLALIARTQGLPLIGTAAAGYGVGSGVGGWAGGATDSQAVGALAGAASGAATGAALGSTIFPGVGTAIGAVVGGLAGLFGGFGETREQQHEIKEAARQADIAGNTAKTQYNGDFFLQQLQTLGVDTSAYQQFVQQQVANAEAGEEPFSFQGISGTADQSYAVAIVGGKLLLQAIQQRNPSITSLAQVSGLREEFINYLLGPTFQGEGLEDGHLPLSDINVTSGFAGLLGPGTYSSGGSQYQWLAKGGTLPAGGEFIVGEQGPELLRAAPGTQVLPMTRGQDGTYAFDPLATARSVVPPNIYLPQVSLPFEGLPRGLTGGQSPFAMPPGQALIAGLNPSLIAPGSVPTMIAALRASGAFPGQGATPPLDIGRPLSLGTIPAQRPPLQLPRPAFASTRPAGPRGQSTLALALQQNRRRRKPNAKTYA